MASGYDLKEGRYDQSYKLVKEIEEMFSRFFKKTSRKESTYKYAMLKSIFDCLDQTSGKTYRIPFDSLFCRFSEIYWILVFKHRIPQKVPAINSPETLAEKVIKEISSKYGVRRKTLFSELSNTIRFELMNQMKEKCSRYVFGALYAETDQLLYSFSKEKEWIKLNPAIVDYFSKHGKKVYTQIYEAWARYYTDVVLLENDQPYYQRLLKRELGNNRVLLCCNPSISTKNIVIDRKKNIVTEEEYSPKIAKKVHQVLKEHPDIGLYVAQVSEKTCEERNKVKYILDNSFWSRRDGSRYYFNDVPFEEILIDESFGESNEENEVRSDDSYDTDEEKISLLNDPELLIKILKEEKNICKSNKKKSKKCEDNVISTKSLQRNWDREEVVILIVEYFRTKNMSQKRINDSHAEISVFLKKREEMRTGQPVDDTFRNVAGIRMQSGRIRCIDPETDYNGMQGTKLQKEVFNEYLRNPGRLKKEAKMIRAKYM